MTVTNAENILAKLYISDGMIFVVSEKAKT